MTTQPDLQPTLPAGAPVEDGVEAASLVANSTFTLAARGYGVVAGSVVALLTVRILPVAEYGRYALAMAIVLLAGALAELGMSALVIRRVAAAPAGSARIVGVALVAQTCTALVAVVLVVPVALAFGYSAEVIVLLAIGCGVILSQGLLAVLNAAFQARRVFSLFALTNAAQTTVILFGSAAVLLAGAGSIGLVCVSVGAYAVATGVAFVLLRRRLGFTPAIAGSVTSVPEFLRSALPIAATAGVAVVYGRIDVLLLARLDSERAVAIYNLPLTIVEISLVIPAAIAGAFYPLLTRQIEEGSDDAREGFDLLFRLFLFGSVPLALVLAVGGGDILGSLFGATYRESGRVLTWLAPAIVFNFLIYLFWYGLLAAHRERGRIPAVIFGLVVNVALNLVLIPAHGATGAAASLAITDLLMAVWLAVVVQRGVVSVPFLGRSLIPAGALVLGLAPVLVLPGLPHVVRGLAGAALYIAILLGLRYVRPPEWAPFLAPARSFLQSRRKR